MALVFEASPWQWVCADIILPEGIPLYFRWAEPLRAAAKFIHDRRDLRAERCAALSAKYLRGYWSENWELYLVSEKDIDHLC
jgi:hypothetical protein